MIETIGDVLSSVVILFPSAEGLSAPHYSLIIWAGLISRLIFIAGRLLMTNFKVAGSSLTSTGKTKLFLQNFSTLSNLVQIPTTKSEFQKCWMDRVSKQKSNIKVSV